MHLETSVQLNYVHIYKHELPFRRFNSISHTHTTHAVQEFCIIGLVALLCDAFLQLFFLPTVLSIDLRRLEVCVSSSSVLKLYSLHLSKLNLKHGSKSVCRRQR